MIDTTGVEKSEEVVGVDWSVSQGCSFSNVHFVMPRGGENKHVGIAMGQVGSGVVVGDCVSWVLLIVCLYRFVLANGDDIDVHGRRGWDTSPESELLVQGACF